MAGTIEAALWSRIQALPDKQQQIMEASRQFEALLIEHLLKTMREAGQEEHPADAGGPMYLEMAEQAMAQALAERGGLGIARLVARGLEGREPGPKDSVVPADTSP